MKGENVVTIAFFALVIGFIVGGVVNGHKAKKYYREQAIENGCAYYSPMTGDFEWGRIK